MRIGLALSGGGIRAAIYHLGVLEYLAECGLYEKIASISSVSGASICIGLIFAVNENKWATAEEFRKKIQPRVKELIINKNIQKAAFFQLLFSPKNWRHRVGMIADMLEEKWEIKGNLQDLPSFPYWEINCTTFETGDRFRFRKDYMGDKKIGYVQQPNLSIAHMIAASAAFPVLIGAYELKTSGLKFSKDKHGKIPATNILNKYTLWDGGVYDNLGLAALHKVGGGLDSEIDFIIVSNAGAAFEEKGRGRPVQNLRRLLDISLAQAESLRTQDFFSSVVSKQKGLYLKIGHNPCSKFSQNYPTTLNSPSETDFGIIFNNGYETARQACLHIKPNQ